MLPAVAYLEILADDGTGLAVRTVPLVGDALTVGRDPGCQLVLAHPTVSRLHVRLWRDAQGWVVQPASQAASLMVHGHRVEQLRLFPGATFSLGAVTLRFADEAPHQAATLQMNAVDARALAPTALAIPLEPQGEAAASAAPPHAQPAAHVSAAGGEQVSPPRPRAPEAAAPDAGGRLILWVVVALSLLALAAVAFEKRGELLAWWAANLGGTGASDAGLGAPLDTPGPSGADVLGEDPLAPNGEATDAPGEARATSRLPLERAFTPLGRPCVRADAPGGDQGAVVTRLGAPPVFSLRLPPPGSDPAAAKEEAWVYPQRGDTLLFEGDHFRGGTRSPVATQVQDAPITPWQVGADPRPECVVLAAGPAFFVTSAIVLPGWNDDAVAHVFRLARGGTMVIVGERLAALHVDPREAFDPPPHVPQLYVGALRPRDGESPHGAVMALSSERMPRLRVSPRGQGTTEDGVEHVVELGRRGRGPFGAADLRVFRVSPEGEEAPIACSGPGLQLAARGDALQIDLSLRCDTTELGLSGVLRNAAWGVRP